MNSRNGFAGLRPNVPADIAAPWVTPPDRAAVQEIPRHVPVYLPEVFPIPDAVEFNPSGERASAAAETQTITLLPTISNALVKIPDQNIGIIRGLSIWITNMLTTTNVRWTLLVNGSPAGGYGSIALPVRATSFAGNSFDCFIRVPDGASIAVQYVNTDGGTYSIGASVSGWYWPIASGKRWLERGV